MSSKCGGKANISANGEGLKDENTRTMRQRLAYVIYLQTAKG